ncbi:MAG: hypothetical protein GWP08_09750 [Nitrospiraceae bacterium]|nr:hypothetical protein [Nitrospiraceae bacterium]
MSQTRREFLTFLGALGLSSSASAAFKLFGEGKGPLTIAAINDIHVLDARSTGLVSRAVNHINANSDVAFTVVLGDLATDGKLGELSLAKSALDRLENPYAVVPGNHDVDPTRKNGLANYEREYGGVQWEEKSDGWVFMGFNSCEGTSSDVTVSAEQMAWISKRVGKINRERPIALFAHHPFNPHTKNYRVKNAEEVLGLFGGHNLKLVATGHWHGNQVETRDGVLFTTTACCSSTRGNFDDTTAKGYRLFHFDKKEVQTEFVTVQA